MSPDPYDGSYDITNPQSLNRYSYVLNNPLSSVDPLGLSDCTAWEIAMGFCTVVTAPPIGGSAPDDPTETGGVGDGPSGGGGAGGQTPGSAPTVNRTLDPSHQECTALAKKINNIVDQIFKRQDAINRNPLGLPQSAPGPLSGSVDGHQELLQGYINDLGAAADLYNNKCGGGPPPLGGDPSSSPNSSPSTSTIKRVAVPIGILATTVGVVGVAVVCPECLVLAPILAF